LRLSIAIRAKRKRYGAVRSLSSPSGMLGTMSKNSGLILAGYEAWNRGDLDAWLETLHPDVEFHTSGLFPDFDPVYRGHAGVAEFWQRLREPWEAFHIDIEQLGDEGVCFWLTGRLRAKGVDSGLAVDMRFAHALRVRDGLVAQIVV